MLKTKEIKGVDFAKSGALNAFCESPPTGFSWEVLGESSSSEDRHKNVYGWKMNDWKPNAPVIFIQAGIHADEWHVAYWNKQFLEQIGNPSISNDPKLFGRLKTKFNFYCLPFLNPAGWFQATVHSGRTNGNGVDLNRNYPYMWDEAEESDLSGRSKGPSAASEPETQISMAKVQELKPVVALDLHTWGGSDRHGFIYGNPERTDLDVISENIYQSYIYTTSLVPYLFRISQPSPTSNAWFSTQKSKNGIFPMTATIEVGNNLPNVEKSRLGQNLLLLFCLYAENWFAGKSFKTPTN